MFLTDILESVEKIESYVGGFSFEKFMKDEKTKDAVVRNLEIIGETVNQIPKNTQERFNEILWRQIIGLRNRLIHSYFKIIEGKM